MPETATYKMSLSILIPSDSDLVQRTQRLPPKEDHSEKDSLWRLALYEVWSLKDSVIELLLQIDLLTTELKLAGHIPRHYPNQKQFIVDGILILLRKGLDKKSFERLSYYFTKMVEMARKVN